MTNGRTYREADRETQNWCAHIQEVKRTDGTDEEDQLAFSLDTTHLKPN